MAGTKIGSLFGDVSLRTAQLDKDIAKVGKKLSKMGKSMSALGRDLSMKLTLPMAAVGVASLKTFADFEKGMNEVKSLMPNLNQGEFVDLTEDVRKLSVTMGVNAVDSTKALYQAISAGVPKENVIDFLRTASMTGIAGLSDTTTAVDTLTSVLNAYGRPAKDAEAVADSLFTTVRLGKTNFEEIGASISQVAPLAAAMNIPLEEMTGALATLTKGGDSTSKAITMIRASLVAMQQPSEKMKEAISNLGFDSGQDLLNAKGYLGALEALRTESGLTASELGEAFGRVEGYMALIGQTGDKFDGAVQDLQAMTDSAGAMSEAFSDNDKGVGRAMARFMGILRDIGIEIGTVIGPKMEELVEQFSQWYLENREGILSWVQSFTEDLIPTITTTVDKFKEWFSENENSIKTWGTLIAKITAFAAVLAPILVPLGLLVGILSSSVTWIASLGIGLGILLNKFGVLEEAGEKFGEAFVKLMDGDVKGAIFSAIGGVWEFIKTFNPLAKAADYMFQKVKPIFTWIWDKLRAISQFASDVIKKLAQLNPLQGTGEALGGWIGDVMYRAEGGPVSSGSPYIVGERGPELFVPRYSGTIVPNHELGGGGQTVNMTFNGVGMEMKAWLKNNQQKIARIAVEAVSENRLRTV
jgi:TP901 family phage tail tape measure protein